MKTLTTKRASREKNKKKKTKINSISMTTAGPNQMVFRKVYRSGTSNSKRLKGYKNYIR
jgi:hypothetical protein